MDKLVSWNPRITWASGNIPGYPLLPAIPEKALFPATPEKPEKNYANQKISICQ